MKLRLAIALLAAALIFVVLAIFTLSPLAVLWCVLALCFGAPGLGLLEEATRGR